MSVNVGRLGWVGIAIEATPGVALNPVDYTPYLTSTMQGKHQPIADIAARGIIEKDFTSVIGKKSGAGELSLNLDPLYAGYFFKMALGAENSAQNGATGVYDHTFTVGEDSQPTTATIYFDKVSYREFYPYSAVSTLEIGVKDSLATIKANFLSQFPATSNSGTLTTTSGIPFTFKDLQVQFGATLAAAQVAAPTKVIDFNLKVTTNVEAIYRSGSTQPDSYATKDFEVSGDYGLYIEGQGEVNNYYNLTKQYAIFTFTGRGIGGGYNELIQIILYQMRINDQPLTTSIDNLFAIKSSFVGEYSLSDTKEIQVLCRNRKSTTY